VVQSLRLVCRTIQDHSRRAERQYGLSAVQLRAVWETHRCPGRRVSESSRVLSIHPSTASNLLDKLERKALVRRVRGGADQRVVRLYVTGQGSARAQRAPRPAQGALTDALHRLSEHAPGSLGRAPGELAAAVAVHDPGTGLPLAED